jgi:hypothetical protein
LRPAQPPPRGSALFWCHHRLIDFPLVMNFS